MEIISRARWGARYANGFRDRPLPATQAWLHHSVTIAPDLVPPFDDDYAAIRALEAIGQQRFGGGISYTRLFTPAGLVFEGHGIGREGSHTGGRNTVAVGYCLVGNYEAQRPTTAQLRALAWCLQHDHRRGWLDAPRLDGGHRDLKATACPGRYGYAAIPAINQLAAGGPITEEDDMQLTDRVDWEKINDLGPAYLGHKLLGTWQLARANRAELAGLRAAVNKLAGAVAGDDLSADDLRAAVKTGVAEALAEGTVNVDIDITGPGGN